MPIYVLLSNLTAEGQQTLHRNPERLGEVNREVEAFGCKVLSQYVLLGEHDFLTVVEAPDDQTVAHLSVDLGSRGTVSIMTMPAISTTDFIQQLKGPKQMGHT